MSEKANAQDQYYQIFENKVNSGIGSAMTNAPVRAYRYYDSSTNVGVKPEFNVNDYNWFRPTSAIPEGKNEGELHEIMRRCSRAYERIGIVRSVVDMMVDFAIEGLEIVHEDQKPQQFWKAWSKKVALRDRAEKFLNWRYKAGNTVVRRRMATIDKKNLKKILEVDDVSGEMPNVVKIPLFYIFYNPATIHATAGEVSGLSLTKKYSIKIRKSFKPENEYEQQVYKSIDKEVQDSMQGKNLRDHWSVPIPDDLIYVSYYKKDDTDIWAKSFLYSILEDIEYNGALKRAKVSTLDNMVSVTRLWKLGDHKAEIFPTQAVGDRLAEVLQNNTGGGPMDIIWGSDINLEEFYPPIEKLVNFEENYNSILMGLGVPEVLIGGNDSSASNATTSLGLKNLVKRLEDGRRALTDWLESEIDIIMKEMRFRKRPSIKFANADLYDERTYFNLLIQLVDRGIISDQRVLEIINELPDMERLRVTREEEMRDSGIKPKKASPYHNPQLDDVQDFQIKLKETGDNLNNESKKSGKEPKGKGRPPGSEDTYQRKRSDAKLSSYAFQMSGLIEKHVMDVMINYYSKQNARQLTSEQKATIDDTIFNLMARTKPGEDVTSILGQIADREGSKEIISDMKQYFSELIHERGDLSKLTYEDKRQFRTLAYIYAWSNR